MNHKSLIEGALFIAGKDGLHTNQLKEMLKISDSDFDSIVEELIVEYERNESRGIVLKKFDDHLRLLTKPEINKTICQLFDIKSKNPLNPAMIEVLAIIAYNEPCTRSKIHELRKSDPTQMIQKLIELKLVDEVGRSEAVGKPYLYQVSKEFYDVFGIDSIKELPEISLPEEDLDDDSDVDFFDSNREI